VLSGQLVLAGWLLGGRVLGLEYLWGAFSVLFVFFLPEPLEGTVSFFPRQAEMEGWLFLGGAEGVRGGGRRQERGQGAVAACGNNDLVSGCHLI